MKLTPTASSRTSTCPAPGCGVSTSTYWRASGPPACATRIAFIMRFYGTTSAEPPRAHAGVEDRQFCLSSMARADREDCLSSTSNLPSHNPLIAPHPRPPPAPSRRLYAPFRPPLRAHPVGVGAAGGSALLGRAGG